MAADRARAWPGARGAGLHPTRAAARAPRPVQLAAGARRAVFPHPESRPQGPVRLRATIVVAGWSGPRRLLREPAQSAEPPARTLGARGVVAPASPAARGGVGSVHSVEPRDARRNPAHRGHLFPQTLD